MKASAGPGPIDFTMMYATHDAFRRDLQRLAAAVGAGRHVAAEVRAGWDNFKSQLLIHHGAEDSHLWPQVRRAAQDRPQALALIDNMEAEHAGLGPMLEAVDAGLAGSAPGIDVHVGQLSAVLLHHLEHEESEGLPLIQSVLTRADWRRFAGDVRRRQGVKGAAVYVPWALDDMPAVKQRQFLSALPAPVRAINRLLWRPRYNRRRLWAP